MEAVWNATATIRIAAIIVNVHVQVAFHAQYVGVSAVCLPINFHSPTFNGSKFIAIQTKTKETCQHGHHVLISCFTLQKSHFNRICVSGDSGASGSRA
jgi:hypothetical protein